MSRRGAAYAAAGIVLVGVAGTSVAFASTAGPDPVTDTATPAASASTTPPATAPVIPADRVIAGVTNEVAKQRKISTEENAPRQQVRICDSTVDGWLRSDSQRLTTKNTGVTVFVGAWRAGAASAAFNDLQQAAARCHAVSKQPGRDQLLATSFASDGNRAVSAVRNGDVLTVVVASSVGADPATIATAMSATAQNIVKARLKGICVDRSARTDSQAATRDPYTPDYSGLRVETKTTVADSAILPSTYISAITSANNPQATWTSPAAKAFPALAPLLPPTAAATAEKGPAPQLIDPAAITPPTDPQPTTLVADEPSLPGPGPQKSKAMTPVVDPVGPGCGWAFTRTAVPESTPRALAVDSQRAIVRSLVDTTAEQGKAMTESLGWSDRYLQWATLRRAQANWDAYQSALAQANLNMTAAKQTYKKSVERWNRGPVAGSAPNAATVVPQTRAVSP
ncbi:MAG: hypothetical protein ACOYD0_12955 [Candidatus Nanopelagicales bacterium]